jgi:hypothetical protein
MDCQNTAAHSSLRNRRTFAYVLLGLPLLGCVEVGAYGDRSMNIPPYAERVYVVLVASGGPEVERITWLNSPPGPRVPGPFPLPAPNRLQVGSGLPRDIATPILEFDRPMPVEGQLYDAYRVGFIWVISAGLKTTLSEVDPTGFDFLRAETRFPDGSRGPDYWLADLVRFVDAYDVDRSVAANPRVIDRGIVNFAFDGSLFRSDAIGDAPFFRIPQSLECLCTARTKKRIEDSGHVILSFSEVGWAV